MAAAPALVLCATCLKTCSENKAHEKPRKLFTEGSPFHDSERGDALLEEARVLMSFSESVSYVTANCDEVDPDHSSAILQLLVLLSEESQHRLLEAKLLREQQAKRRVQS